MRLRSENAPFRYFAPRSCVSGLVTTCEMLQRFSAVCVLLLALLAGTATAATPEPTLRLRGGGIMSTMADKLGWKRTKVGSRDSASRRAAIAASYRWQKTE